MLLVTSIKSQTNKISLTFLTIHSQMKFNFDLRMPGRWILYIIIMLISENLLYSQDIEDSCLVLKNVAVFDHTSQSFQYDMTILIKDGYIKSVQQTEKVDIPKEAKIFNLSGKYVIPGLIEGHTHLRNFPDKQLEYALRWGITSVRSMADDASYLQKLNTAIQNGDLLGPEIYYSALFAGRRLFEEDSRTKLATPENFTLGSAPWMRMVDESSNMKDIVNNAKDCGACGIKLYNYLNFAQIQEITDYAHCIGLKVWSHPHLTYADGKDIALAGVDLITHAMAIILPHDWDLKTYKSFDLDLKSIASGRLDSILTIVKNKDIMLEPTFVMFFSGIRNEIKEDSLRLCIEHAAIQVIKEAFKRGICIVAGTDESLPQESDSYPALFDEMKYFVDLLGMTPSESIISATYLGAKALGIEKTHGSIEKNKIANVVVLNDNPVEDINNINQLIL